MIKNITFIKLNKKNYISILKIRNQKEIRKNMFNKKIIKLSEHKKWFEKKVNSGFFNHYVLKHKKKIVGVGYGENFDLKSKSCYWGLYVDQSIKSNIKYGSILKYFLFEKIFSNNSVNKIKSQVIRGNEKVRDWYVRWGNKLIKYKKD